MKLYLNISQFPGESLILFPQLLNLCFKVVNDGIRLLYIDIEGTLKGLEVGVQFVELPAFLLVHEAVVLFGHVFLIAVSYIRIERGRRGDNIYQYEIDYTEYIIIIKNKRALAPQFQFSSRSSPRQRTPSPSSNPPPPPNSH